MLVAEFLGEAESNTEFEQVFESVFGIRTGSLGFLTGGMSVERGLVALLWIHDDRLSGLAYRGEFSD